ncbi:hypothetical protein Microterr_04400 [Microbacterium terricola]|uniref:Uncharacterized protein n=1 Tax=Microbacterium terricola TaxID=344163 RepID=A0ABM8DW86_9MICO|nr:hypothetical protein Microterr_04400 [Microbacterium terricola]
MANASRTVEYAENSGLVPRESDGAQLYPRSRTTMMMTSNKSANRHLLHISWVVGTLRAKPNPTKR